MAGKEGATGNDARPAFPHEVLAALFQVRERCLSVLLWRRAEEPYDGRWALPGGLLAVDELLGTALARMVASKVDVHTIAHLEQLETRSEPARDPRTRTLATAYLGIIPTDVRLELPADTCWRSVERLPAMAFDHRSIVRSAHQRLKAKLSYTNVGFALAPKTFTMTQLSEIYHAVLGYDVSVTNLNRVLTRRGVIERTEHSVLPLAGTGRPANVYRFADRALRVTDPFAVFRPSE